MGRNLRGGAAAEMSTCRNVPSELHQSGSALTSGGGRVGRGSWGSPAHPKICVGSRFQQRPRGSQHPTALQSPRISRIHNWQLAAL